MTSPIPFQGIKHSEQSTTLSRISQAPPARPACDPARRPACRPPLASPATYGHPRGRGCRPARWGRPVKRPALPRLMRELIRAHQRACENDLSEALAAYGLHHHGGPLWGVAFVEIDENHYAPDPGGRPALIVPHFDGNVLLDLVACGLQTRTCRTREGICTALGLDHIERAKEAGTAVRLFADPIDWLRNGRRGAVIVDWRAARFTLADLPGIACEGNCSRPPREALKQPAQIPTCSCGSRRMQPRAPPNSSVTEAAIRPATPSGQHRFRSWSDRARGLSDRRATARDPRRRRGSQDAVQAAPKWWQLGARRLPASPLNRWRT